MLSHLSRLACITLLLSQEAVCSTNYTLNVNLTTNSPLNCSAGLTYPGVFLTVEYRWLEKNGSDLVPSEWTLLDRVILEPSESALIFSRYMDPSIAAFFYNAYRSNIESYSDRDKHFLTTEQYKF